MEKKKLFADYTPIILLFLFSILFVLLNSKNSPLYLFNEWGDVNIYFSVGKGMANGLIPYKDLFDHKGPFIFFIYSIAYLISNSTFLGVCILQGIALFINPLFAYKLSRLYLNTFSSYLIALIYAVLLFNKNYYGGSAEEFISVFISISFYYFVLYFRGEIGSKEGNKQMFIHGLMFGLAFLSKLSVCVFWMPLIAAILLQLLLDKRYKAMLQYMLYFVLGFGATLLPFLLYFLANNALKDAYWGYIEFNSLYAEFRPDMAMLRKTVGHFGKLLIGNYLSFGITVLGVFLLSFTKKYVANIYYRIAVLLSFIFSFAIICIAKYIMTYAHVVIYVYALFGLIFVFALIEKFIREKYWKLLYPLSFITLLGVGVYNKQFFGQDIDCLLKKKECNYMQKEFAYIINKEHSPTLLNIGLDLGVFTKANIVPSYKYFFYPNIPYHIYPEIRDYQVNLIQKKEPMFIIIGDKSAFYDMYKDLPALKENYDLISVYNQNLPEYDKQVFLYKRKD